MCVSGATGLGKAGVVAAAYVIREHSIDDGTDEAAAVADANGRLEAALRWLRAKRSFFVSRAPDEDLLAEYTHTLSANDGGATVAGASTTATTTTTTTTASAMGGIVAAIGNTPCIEVWPAMRYGQVMGQADPRDSGRHNRGLQLDCFPLSNPLLPLPVTDWVVVGGDRVPGHCQGRVAAAEREHQGAGGAGDC